MVSATDARPGCDLSLSDGVNTVNLYLCKANGQLDPNQMRQSGYPRQALRFNPAGAGSAADMEPPYTQVSQGDFSGGRGQERLALNATRFYDSYRADTIRGRLYLGPKETYTTGYYASLNNYTKDGDYQLTGPAGSTKLAATKITPGSQIAVRKVQMWLKKTSSTSYPVQARVSIYSDSSGPNNLLVSSDWKTFNSLGSSYTAYNFDVPPTTLSAATVYWIALEISASDTIYVGKKGAATGFGIYTKTTGSWSNEVPNQALAFTLYTVASGYAFMFEYKGAMYAVSRSDDQTAPTLWINGYRGKATSNTADKTKLNTTLNLSGVDLTGKTVRIIAGPGSREEYPYRKIVSNTQTGTNDVITVDKIWKITHTASTDFVVVDCDWWVAVSGHGLTQPITDVCVIDSIVYFCQGDQAYLRRMQWSGTSHAFAADGTTYAELLKYYVDGSGKKKLVMVKTGTNDVAMAGVVAWGANLTFGTAINCGSEDERITNVDFYGGSGTPMIPYVLKEGSFGSVSNGVYAESPNSEFACVRSLDNGRASLRHNDYLYFAILRGMLLRYVAGHLDSMGPDLDEGLPEVRQGPIRDLVGYAGRFYACIDAGDDPGRYSCVLCYNYQGWHEVYRAPEGKRIRQMHIQTIPGSSIAKLWLSEEEDLVWLPLAVDPLKESGYTFTSTCDLITSWIDLDYQDVNKYFSASKLITRGCVAGHQEIDIYYQLDNATDADAWTLVGTVNVSPSQKLQLSGQHNANGKRMRLKLTLRSDDPTTTPQVLAWVTDNVLRLPVKHSWSLTVLLEDYPFDLNGVRDNVATVTSQMDLLEGWANSETGANPLLMRHWDDLFDNLYVLIEPSTAQPLEGYVEPATGVRKNKLMATLTLIEE
jgi:hypothetical protein